jgi:DNA polymerase-3 subunit epsilon
MPFQNLSRDLCFFDIESTGLHVIRDRIVQLAIIKYPANGGDPIERCELINPGIPIAEEAIKVHGITPEVVRNKPSFAQLAADLFDFIGDADLCGYNSNRFDIPLLVEEFARAGLHFDLRNRRMIDVQRIFYKMEPRTLKAAVKFYCDREFEDAHDALEDVRATVDVLRGQLERYQGVDVVEDDGTFLPQPVRAEVQALHDFTNDARLLDATQRLRYNDKGEVVFNFGKYSGEKVTDVFTREPSYYHWMKEKDFSAQVKQIIEEIYQSLRNAAAK